VPQLPPAAAQYRLQLLRTYLRTERGAVRVVASTPGELVDAIRELQPSGIRSLAPLMRATDGVLAAQRAALRSQLASGYEGIADATLRYQAARSAVPIFSTKTIQRLTQQAERAVIAGKNVGQRISLLSGAERTALRQRFVLGLRQGAAPEHLIHAVEQYYVGVSTGAAGPAYAARRLVQSELTRLNGRVAEEAAYLIRKETGIITVLIYHTQGDDRVRDSHEALEGQFFVEDEVEIQISEARPVSEALDALSDPNCRCWLDVDHYVEAA